MKSFLDIVTSLSWCLWLLSQEPEEINPEEELEDICDDKEDDLGAVEEQRSVILHLLSQLKLGMDLTRVSNWCVTTGCSKSAVLNSAAILSLIWNSGL